MDIKETDFTLEHFQNANIDSIVDGIEDDIKYRTAFQEAADNIKDSDENSHNVYCLMSAIMSMHFKHSDTQNPFGPMFVLDGCRSFVSSDLNKDQLGILSQFYGDIKDAQLRARIADLVWLGLRRPEDAKNAIASYLDAAKVTEHPENWTTCANYYERALRLSSMFQQKDDQPFYP